MLKLTVGIFFYNIPHMIERQCKHWRNMPADLVQHVEILFIDDCSKEPITHDHIRQYLGDHIRYRLLRVLKDIPWNWGVKNLVWTQANTQWVFFNDADYFFGADTLARMLELTDNNNPNEVYFFKLRDDDVVQGGAINKPPEWAHWRKDWPAAQYLAHVHAVQSAGGYNEDLAGRRGYDDNLIRDGYAAVGVKEIQIPECTVWMDWDGRVPGLNRNSEENKKLYYELRKNPVNTGSIIRYPWTEVPYE